jgi:hypothetical protein
MLRLLRLFGILSCGLRIERFAAVRRQLSPQKTPAIPSPGVISAVEGVEKVPGSLFPQSFTVFIEKEEKQTWPYCSQQSKKLPPPRPQMRDSLWNRTGA